MGNVLKNLDLDQLADRLNAMGVSAVVETTRGEPVLNAGELALWPDAHGIRDRAVRVGIDAHIPGDLDVYDPGVALPGKLGLGSHDDERDGEYIADGATLADVADRVAELARRVEQQRRRLEEVVETTVDAFWSAVGGAYPEVVTGDFGPGETMQVEVQARAAIKLMLRYNRPIEGIAGNRHAADEIVAARRDAAIKRITPMVTVVKANEPDALADVLHEMLQDDASERVKGYDNEKHPDWLVWSAVYERASTLHEATYTATAAELAALMVDHLGSYGTVRALIEAAPDELCDGRLEDGDLCGAPLDDGEGYDGKCGNCADRAEAA